MRTNVVLDDQMVKEALEISKVKTKKDLLNLALHEYIKNHKVKNLLDIKGKISFQDDYDYKMMRKEK